MSEFNGCYQKPASAGSTQRANPLQRVLAGSPGIHSGAGVMLLLFLLVTACTPVQPTIVQTQVMEGTPTTAPQPTTGLSPKPTTTPPQPSTSSPEPTATPFWPLFGDKREQCADIGSIIFTAPPIDLAYIEAMIPMGRLAFGSGHVTPTDHMYIVQEESAPRHDVYALGDGYIVEIQRMPGGEEDYRIVFEYSCTFSSYYIHIKELAPGIRETIAGLPEGESVDLRIPVTAGQIIGKAQTFDLGVMNEEITLTGFAVPEHYERESWKFYTVDPFDYFAEPIRGQLLEKSARTAQPLGGKIDYDIDGRLVGNWFLEGTQDYSGGGVEPYWYGHLSIAYDNIDPAEIRIASGAETGITESMCNVCPYTGFGVRGNAPDPANISVDSGLVKYELVAVNYIDNVLQTSERKDDILLGVFLVEMLDDRTIRVEIVPGKTADQVTGFSEAAQIYRR